MRCVNFTRSRESAHSYGRIIGCRSLYRKLSEALKRPHALISPFLPRAQDSSDSSSGVLQKNTCAECKLSCAAPRRQRPGPLDGLRKEVIVFDIAGQIDGHTREPAKFYLVWKSDPGNEMREFYQKPRECTLVR